MSEREYDFGPCCICEKDDDTVRNVIALNFRAPTPKTGWGCAKCGRPSNGALVIVCDQCMEDHDKKIDTAIKFVIRDFPAKKQRMAIENIDVSQRFEHDMSQHTDELGMK